MAEVQANDSHDKGGKNKQKKQTLRVDFTPMVDMNMLLITFFMFCTSLIKPQTMEISMPDKDGPEDKSNKVQPDRAITILLAAEGKVYYYLGEPDYKDYNSLKETNFPGLRKLLLGKNADMITKLEQLKEDKKKKKITEEIFAAKSKEIKGAKTVPVVVIKPMDDASYNTVVDTLDEMLVCSISKYAVVDFTEVDDFLLKNLLTQGKAAEGTPN
jgi:biopolymer transport protein ExbD